MCPLTMNFRPGDRYFDHFDLAALENPDFYPDGRDLGENYTLTSWRMSPCAKSGQLDCVHCHTSSGRYRFKDRPNDACLPCHEERVENAAAHTHHPGTARHAVHRLPHAHDRVRPHAAQRPLDAAADARRHPQLDSPNACNLCHANRDAPGPTRRSANGAAAMVGADPARGPARRGRAQAGLVEAAGDPRLPREPGRDEILTVSLVRLLAGCPGRREVAGAARARRGPLAPRARGGARGAGATRGRDSSSPRRETTLRLVRVRAATALAAITRRRCRSRTRRLSRPRRAERSLRARPDDFSSHYNLGNLHLERGDPAAAAERYRKALALRPDHVASLVNLSMAEARLGRLAEAEAALREAIRVEPREAAAHFNLGLLLAERQRPAEAQAALRRALELDPRNAAAAYNLAVLVAAPARRRPRPWPGGPPSSRRRSPATPSPRPSTSRRLATRPRRERALRALVVRHPGYRDGWALLGALLEGKGDGRGGGRLPPGRPARPPSARPTARPSTHGPAARPD